MSQLPPFPNGSDHAPFPSISARLPQWKHGRVPKLLPLTSHAPLFWLPPLADSQDSVPPRGLAALWTEKRPLVQPTSLGPAVTCAADLFGPSSHLEHRDVSRSSRAHCVRWVARLCQKTSLVLVPLGGTGQFDWTSRRLHSSRHTGRASTSGRQKPSLVLSHWTGQDDWTLKLAGF